MAEILKIMDYKITVPGRKLSRENYSTRIENNRVERRRYKIFLPEDANDIWDYIYENDMVVDLILIVKKKPQNTP